MGPTPSSIFPGILGKFLNHRNLTKVAFAYKILAAPEGAVLVPLGQDHFSIPFVIVIERLLIIVGVIVGACHAVVVECDGIESVRVLKRGHGLAPFDMSNLSDFSGGVKCYRNFIYFFFAPKILAARLAIRKPADLFYENV